MTESVDAFVTNMEGIRNTRRGYILRSKLHKFPRRDTVRCLMQRLGEFGSKHFGLFRDHYYPAQVHLEEYPREYALAVILDQMACDLEVIERAMNQRILACVEATDEATGTQPKPAVEATARTAVTLAEPDKFGQKLDRADRLAWHALKPAREAGFFDVDGSRGDNRIQRVLTVLTYFQKQLQIRVIPYAPVALIGIPYQCMDNDQKLLAIPHEIGHYVYWHGLIKRQNGRGLDYFSKELDWRLRFAESQDKPLWAEEIFADVYGCLCAGPVLALDFQDLQLEYSKEGFTWDDGEHPVPAVRPWVYQRVLNYLRDKFACWPNSCPVLQTRWERKFDQRRIEYNLLPEELDTLQRERTAVERITDIILDMLAPLVSKMPRVKEQDQWCGDLKPHELYEGADSDSATRDTEWFGDFKPDELYESFIGRLGALSLEAPKDLDSPLGDMDTQKDDDVKAWNRLVTDPNQRVTQVNSWVQWLVTRVFSEGASLSHIVQNPGELTRNDWLDLLRADGWVTKGPSGHWRKKPGHPHDCN